MGGPLPDAWGGPGGQVVSTRPPAVAGEGETPKVHPWCPDIVLHSNPAGRRWSGPRAGHPTCWVLRRHVQPPKPCSCGWGVCAGTTPPAAVAVGHPLPRATGPPGAWALSPGHPRPGPARVPPGPGLHPAGAQPEGHPRFRGAAGSGARPGATGGSTVVSARVRAAVTCAGESVSHVPVPCPAQARWPILASPEA